MTSMSSDPELMILQFPPLGMNQYQDGGSDSQEMHRQKANNVRWIQKDEMANLLIKCGELVNQQHRDETADVTPSGKIW